jgi:D-lactate dehydrogenase
MEKEYWKSLLEKIIPSGRIKTRYLDLIAYASDAGFYHLVPKAVVQPVSIEEIQLLFAFSATHAIPITFRGGGTSLSGQSVSDGILVDLGKYWRMARPENNGSQVRVQPGITGAMVNASLRKYKTKIGPDPSTINAAMMGGILANNSSGMCCGVAHNSYHTLSSIKLVLPDGKVFNTEEKSDYGRFENECPAIFLRLKTLKERIENNEALFSKIRHKYKIKNTVGYSLNSFLDHDHPLDILAHLFIGSEGTLGFIAEAVLHTVPDLSYKSTTLLYFPDMYSACSAIIPLKDSGAGALELMDRAALRSIEMIPGVPPSLIALPANAAALLCEYQTNTASELAELVGKAEKVFKEFTLLHAPEFTVDQYQQAFLWKLRKGMFPSVGAIRKQGTSVILEDVAFPLESLADAVIDVQKLFVRHQYDNGIIFGHAKDGNIHFVVSQSFNTPEEVKKYEFFMNDVVELVIKKYQGALKAEHGTGRNMAPFVETEWGSEAYEIMKEVKTLLDPLNLLNPGVIINEDKQAHLKNLKSMPVVEPEVDKCIECGYCENRCPSRDLTLTPRQRIVVRREMARANAIGDLATWKELKEDYQYDGMDTCAVDGLCATDCPVNINTGDLIKRLRKENHSALQNRIALFIARNFKIAESVTTLALKCGQAMNDLAGNETMSRITKAIRNIIPGFPQWPRYLAGPSRFTSLNLENAEVVYFPACTSRMMGASSSSKASVTETFINVAGKAGIKVAMPAQIKGHCCGQAFSSKGFSQAASVAMNKTIESLWEWTRNGNIPVVMDLTSCTHTLLTCRPFLSQENAEKFDSIKIYDSINYASEVFLPRLKISRKKTSVILHPVCSLSKMNLEQKFKKIAEACATSVTIPVNSGCCGMAGDRGFFYPELIESATKQEAMEVNENRRDGYYSSAKTCEISLSGATSHEYESILYLLDEAAE